MKMTAIIPKELLTGKMAMAAVERGLDFSAQGVQTDFLKTVTGWKGGRSFKFPIQSKPAERVIGTSSEKYGWVNFGTKPHMIAPRRKKALAFFVGGRPKTMPRVIGSSSGSRGTTRIIRRRPIRHPGTKAREFDQAIAEQWDGGPLRDAIQSQLDATAGAIR